MRRRRWAAHTRLRGWVAHVPLAAEAGHEGTAPSAGQSEAEARALLAAIVESTGDAIIGTDLQSVITSWNHGAERMYGYRPEEVMGRPIALLVPPGRRQELEEIVAALWRGERVVRHETLRLRKDGSPVDVEVTVSPIFGAAGEPVGASSIVRDVSARKRAEEELKRSNEELEQFAYAASHDLSEPLRVIAGFVELLAQRYRGRLDEDADRFIGFTVAGVERMQAVIDDLLVYSRAGRVALARSDVDAGALVGDVLQALVVAIVERGTCVEVGALPRLRAEPTLLRQVFQNLIGNAVKFTDGPDPHVYVRARRDGHCWRFEVQDNGPGIEAHHAERVFEMFQRLHGREVPGTGIGLAIAKRIVERHGGTIACEPAPGAGSIFSFTIPEDTEVPA